MRPSPYPTTMPRHAWFLTLDAGTRPPQSAWRLFQRAFCASADSPHRVRLHAACQVRTFSSERYPMSKAMVRRVCGMAMLALVLLPLGVAADSEGLRAPGSRSPTHSLDMISLDVTTSTWKPHARMSFQIEGLIRAKLTSAGFHVLAEGDQRHALVLKVVFREEPGKASTPAASVTDITCLLALRHPTQDRRLELVIRETTRYGDPGTFAYVDATQEFENNPYVYFFGEILREWLDSGQDPAALLILALQQHLERAAVSAPPVPGGYSTATETIQSPELSHAAYAIERAIDEFGRLQDSRAVPLLITLLGHSEASVRLRAVIALGAIRSTESIPVIERLAQKDASRKVRRAAASTLNRLTASSSR